MKTSLKERLKNYFSKRPKDWVAKGMICDIARNSDLHATGEHTGRRLRELVEEGTLEVKYERGAALYRMAEKMDSLAWFDSLPS